MGERQLITFEDATHWLHHEDLNPSMQDFWSGSVERRAKSSVRGLRFARQQRHMTEQTRPGKGVKKSPWRVFERIAEELKATGVILDKGSMQ
ncbi:MAG: hypothetical protein QOJ99_2589 [Bryobacterales bacterium]|jgi:hypothetical protein|nr:hypothetical protein [Bryobacterales bacterium]